MVPVVVVLVLAPGLDGSWMYPDWAELSLIVLLSSKSPDSGARSSLVSVSWDIEVTTGVLLM